MPLRYQTVNTITNGVELTPENVGKKVEWTAVLKDLQTGEVHRTHEVTGTYVGDFAAEEAHVQDYLYAQFTDSTINGFLRGLTGSPKAFFTLAENHPKPKGA